MAKLILKHDDGTEEVLRYNQPDDGYFAMKLWCDEDILNMIEQNPDATDKTFDYIDYGDLKGLDECSDGDWEIISYAIDEAIKREKGES